MLLYFTMLLYSTVLLYSSRGCQLRSRRRRGVSHQKKGQSGGFGADSFSEPPGWNAVVHEPSDFIFGRGGEPNRAAYFDGDARLGKTKSSGKVRWYEWGQAQLVWKEMGLFGIVDPCVAKPFQV